jgi:hypothetical protein
MSYLESAALSLHEPRSYIREVLRAAETVDEAPR